MPRRGRALRAALAAMVAAGVAAVTPARATGLTGLEGIKGADDRMIVNAGEYPWSAIGRLNSRTGSFCTAALIGRRLVLTAAHCLWNERTQAWLPPVSLHFLAGYQRGAHIAHGTVARTVTAPGFKGGTHYGDDQGANDWALVELNEDLGGEVGHLGLRAFNAADAMTTAGTGTFIRAGYSQDRKHVPMAHLGCGFLGQNRAGQLLHDCDAVHGDSGSPIFGWRDGGFRIVAIHVSTIGRNGRIYGGSVGADAFLDTALRLGASGDAFTGRGGRTPVDTTRALLGRLGYAAGNGTASLDDTTVTAIRTFQQRAGLPETGMPSASLLGHLLQWLAHVGAAQSQR